MPYNDIIDRGAADALVPTEEADVIFSSIDEESHFLSLATKLEDMQTDQESIPVLDALPVAFFVNGDTGLIQSTKMAWKDVYVYAEKLACYVPVPENVLEDSKYDIWGQTRPKIVNAMGKAIDAAAFNSTNKPSRWPVGLIPGAVAAGNVVLLSSFSGNTALYDAVLGETGLITAIEMDGYLPNGHVAVTSMRGRYRGMKGTDGHPIFSRMPQEKAKYELDGEPILFPRTKPFLPTDALQLSGDFTQVVYSKRRDLRWKILDQSVITDTAGNIILNAAQQDCVIMKVTMRLGWALPNPVNYENENSATRYPFGVLKAS